MRTDTSLKIPSIPTWFQYLCAYDSSSTSFEVFFPLFFLQFTNYEQYNTDYYVDFWWNNVDICVRVAPRSLVSFQAHSSSLPFIQNRSRRKQFVWPSFNYSCVRWFIVKFLPQLCLNWSHCSSRLIRLIVPTRSQYAVFL